MAVSAALSLDCKTVKKKKKCHSEHEFLQSSLITSIKAETFWQ